MPVFAVKPPFPILNRAHPLARELVAAYLYHAGVGLVATDISGGSPNAVATNGVTWETGTLGRQMVYGATHYSTILANVAPGAVPVSLGQIAASGSSYSVVSGFSTANAAAIGTTAPWSFGACLFEGRNTGGSTAHAWAVGAEAGKWGTARTVNVASAGGQRIVTTTSVNDGVLHHCAATVAVNDVALYIDGRLDATGAFNSAFATGDSSLATGVGNVYIQVAARTTNVAGYSSNLTGRIAYFYLYDRALSADEVAALAVDPYLAFRPTRLLERTLSSAVSATSLRNAAIPREILFTTNPSLQLSGIAREVLLTSPTALVSAGLVREVLLVTPGARPQQTSVCVIVS